MNQNALPANKIAVNCIACSGRYTISAGIQKRNVEESDVVEVGVSCPDCGDWTHSYYTNPDLEEKRKRVSEISRNPMLSLDQKTRMQSKLRKEIQRDHDRLQREMRPKP